ncbi:MAG: hypothetical protein CL417_01350 [Acidimicrobiaceae bacterium]|nr:hypothetical protein [Acidimicrobiaceae bacterium]|tara:strand:+ start:16667 stop:16954 length:288 start_codon:yes stop_codon:yes gene_type:complete
MGIAMKYVDEYNGWSNYETWKMNLEFFDGYPWEDYEDLDMGFPSFGEYLKGMAEEWLEEITGDCNLLLKGMAEDWLVRVNWDEIADGIRSNYREV